MKIHTDVLMQNLAITLRKDLRCTLGMHEGDMSKVLNATCVEDFRANIFTLHENMTAYQYKWCAQVNSFLKRYTFQHDILTPREREALTDEKFLRLQEALAASYQTPRSYRAALVISRARSIVKGILSKVVLEENLPGARFGTKATLGCPASSCYIDEKLLDRPVTGSDPHLRWFKDVVLANDHILAEIMADNQVGQTRTDALKQVNVPKKYNIDRGINPNTLVGSLYTDGLGKILTEALKLEGLNISTLQKKHRQYVVNPSKYSCWEEFKNVSATADMSDASHGYLSHLLNALLPRKWYNAVMRGVIRQVEVSSKVYRLESIMTMGIGFTFPMQTLLFYAILCAVAQLADIHGKISVYGDDLIYPQKLHPYVVGIFADLGFKLNLEKTYVRSKFKESCGSDFFRGVDVRPFSPELAGCMLPQNTYVAFCYKLLNGLLSRWSHVEIEHTTRFLLREIARLTRSVFIVEDHFPETSGLRVSFISTDDVWYYVYDIGDVAPWRWFEPLACYSYPYLKTQSTYHEVLNHLPYYWEKLRSIHDRECISRPFFFSSPEDVILGSASMTWKKFKKEKAVLRYPNTGRKAVTMRKGRKYARVARAGEPAYKAGNWTDMLKQRYEVLTTRQ